MSTPPAPEPTRPPTPAEALVDVVTEIERHVGVTGWDQPPRLYALVDTGDLVAREPALAGQLGLDAPGGLAPLTPVEQESLPPGPGGSTDLSDVLVVVAWPAEVLGCALALEVMWGRGADDEPVTPADAAGEGRLAVGVLRDGARAAVLHVRPRPGEDGNGDLLSGPDLAEGLADALDATLQEADGAQEEGPPARAQETPPAPRD